MNFKEWAARAVWLSQGQRLLVVDAAKVDDDLVRDETERPTPLRARPCGHREANRTTHAIAAITGGVP